MSGDRCEICGHAGRRHNELHYCQVLYRSTHEWCPCNGTREYENYPEVVASRARFLAAPETPKGDEA